MPIRPVGGGYCEKTSGLSWKQSYSGSNWEADSHSETNIHRHTHLWLIITCFRTDEFLRPLQRGREGRERNSTLSLCLQRKSIYTHNAGNALFVYTDTYAHVLRISINRDRENNTPGCQEIKLEHCYGICECVCVCICVSIFPSFTPPTWQGNSQSSDLKEGETGRGGGERGKERAGDR